MFNIDNQSNIPIYEQIIRSVEKGIMLGIYQENEKILSVRALSVKISINPNTIQKAYQELEKRNIIYSVKGSGNYVCENAKAILESNNEQYFDELKACINSLKLFNISKEDVLKIVDEVYESQ